MAKTQRAKADAVTAPQDEHQCAVMIKELGDLQRQRSTNQNLMEDKVEAIKTGYLETIGTIDQRIAEKLKAIHAYCAANRDALTKHGKIKTHKFGTGTISWRDRPPSVSLRGVADILERLKKSKRLKKFIRIKHEINKEAMLDDPDVAGALKGVTIKAGEDFIVKPTQTEIDNIEEVAK